MVILERPYLTYTVLVRHDDELHRVTAELPHLPVPRITARSQEAALEAANKALSKYLDEALEAGIEILPPTDTDNPDSYPRTQADWFSILSVTVANERAWDVLIGSWSESD